MDRVEVTVGVIGRAHGVRGEVAVEPRTDEIERRFASGAVLGTGDGGRLTVAKARQASGRLIVAFAEVPDRTAAEALRGTELLVEVPADESPSGAEEYFDRQLVGLEVRDAAGNPAGLVVAVLHGPAQDILLIDTLIGQGGDERMVPFVEALVPIVDLEAGYLQLADVGGLLEDLPEDD